ncbi:L-aspartate oxidase [Evansella halocellulosilytica]|uniref:L-aspartate oxidase n=1 Tax=Evansella halocellulosilytica TaxID=2011013 RepID=UPI000BB6F6F5|nr:L-aspartate oxidase [Evansella halocellulosilytica]
MSKQSVIIVGAGMAALVTASILSLEKNVKLFSKGPLKNGGNSWRAQGGIAAVMNDFDSTAKHYEDTLEAGGYHHNHEAVKILVEKGPKLLQEWMKDGMQFDKDDNGELSLGMEGAHKNRRILHAGGDRTGKYCMEYLHRELPGNVEVIQEQAIDLLVKEGKCYGVMTKKQNGSVHFYEAEATVLATGGCGGLYSYTSNDPSLIGEGLTFAYRAGAKMSDLEFIQFHPTVIHHDGNIFGLASEALRGEGAVLIDDEGNEIMLHIDLRGDLAPRDIVARTVYKNEQAGKGNYLDISSVNHFNERFPGIKKICEEAGIDLSKKRIPITTGAHFHMGGIVTDIHGRSSVEHLYAVGEVAHTGVHGTNRLASNSLLEAVVFGTQAANDILMRKSSSDSRFMKDYVDESMKLGKEPDLPTRTEIKKQISQALGVTRHEADLRQLIQWIETKQFHSWKGHSRMNWSLETIERAAMITTAWLIARSALTRDESRGAHYRTDYPSVNKEWNYIQLIHIGENLQKEKLEELNRCDKQVAAT